MKATDNIYNRMSESVTKIIITIKKTSNKKNFLTQVHVHIAAELCPVMIIVEQRILSDVASNHQYKSHIGRQ